MTGVERGIAPSAVGITIQAMRHAVQVCLALVVALAVTPTAPAQTNDGFQVLPDLQGLQPPAPASSDEPLTVSATLEVDPQTRLGRLSVTAAMAREYHTYSVTQPPGGPQRTQLVLELPPGVELRGEFQPDSPPEVHPPDVFKVPTEEHHGTVTWSVNVAVAEDVDLESLVIPGVMKGQVCHAQEGCRPIRGPQGRFTATARVVSDRQIVAPPAPPDPATELAANDPGAAAGTIQEAPKGVTLLERIQVEQQAASLPFVLGIAMLGGLILNLMPCVLPVIGLKILAFVEQAGESRTRVLALNIAYSLGILGVFMVLATLVSLLNLRWGQQFSYNSFTIAMSVLVFTMALSFFGVWEIPIPGFATSRTATKLSEREGYIGAFAKGVVATLLATPCGAPYVTPALGWCYGKPLPLVYLVFASMAVGMSLPYLVLGFRPQLLRFLPRPGAWMETFKQLMGFVLLATVVYLLTTVSPANILPTVALLFGCWAACWYVGRVPYTADRSRKIRAAAVAVAIIVSVGGFAFARQIQLGDMTLWGLRGAMERRLVERGWQPLDADPASQVGAPYSRMTSVIGSEASNDIEQVGFELPWEPYSLERLVQLTESNRTVMIDFTADWCPNCIALERTVLNTRPIKEAVERLDVATLKADFDRPDVVELADRLGRMTIPILAIFPRGNPERPILLPTAYTRAQLLEALEKANSSPGEVASEVASR